MKDTLLETSQLQTMVAVAHAGSFSRAAENLHVTQSAISQSIKNLESKVDVKLFNRSGKKIGLTNEGEKLYKMAKDMLTRMEDVLEELHVDKNSMSGKVRIGTLNGVGKSWLAHKILNFSQAHPDISLSLVMDKQENLVRQFEKNVLDFLVLPEYALPTNGEKVFITEEKSTLVFPASNPFGIDENINLEKLSTIPLVWFEDDDPIFQQWCRMRFGAPLKKAKPRFTINSHGYLLHAVAQGLGAAVIPTHVLNRSSQKEKVKTLGEEYEVSNYSFYLVYHKEVLDILRCKKIVEILLSDENPFV